MGEEHSDSEKRNVARRHLVFYLRIFDGSSSRVLGHLMDISPDGLMLLSDEAIEINKEYSLRMRLPQEKSQNAEIVFGAVSRWCRQDDNPDFYVIGFQIRDLDVAAKDAVKRLITEFGFRD